MDESHGLRGGVQPEQRQRDRIENTMSNAKSVIEMARKNGAKMFDIKFVDTFGTWQHFSCPMAELSEEAFAEGVGFDGSSIRGWKSIEVSDMLAMPDPGHRLHGPLLQRADPFADLHHRRDGDQGGLHAGPPGHRPAGGEVSSIHSPARHRQATHFAEILARSDGCGE